MDTRFQSDDRESHLQSNLDKPAYRREVDPPSIVLPNKPEGSVIKEQETAEGFVMWWNGPSGKSAGDIFGVGFLCFWLCGWAVGEIFVLGALIVGVVSVFQGNLPLNASALCPGLFMVAWLGGWTFGGIMAMRQVWNMLRPLQPERLILTDHSLRYDPGDKHLFASPELRTVNSQGTYDTRRWNSAQDLREKLRRVERTNLPPFHLDRVGERQRLTFDDGADRVEIGDTLREPEREWLHQVLEAWRLTLPT